MQYMAQIQGGAGPDVWDNEVFIDASDFMDAAQQASAEAEESGGQVTFLDQCDCSETEAPRNLKKPTLLAVCLTCLLVAGCNNDTEGRKAANIHLLDYRCTNDQLDLVQKEFSICTETGYLDTFCLKSAKATQCDRIETTEVEGN